VEGMLEGLLEGLFEVECGRSLTAEEAVAFLDTDADAVLAAA
jgi:hypothetical protein